MGIYDRLNYNFDGTGVTELSSNTKSFMNTVPSLLSDWQKEDIANNDVGGYFQNPVATITQTLRNHCNTIIVLLAADPLTNTNAITGATESINTAFASMLTNSANIAGNNGGFFIAHTDRISGVTTIEQSVALEVDTANVPHYETAMATGQLMMYITNQADDISNNSPIMGSFTSILIADKLQNLNNNISTYYETVNGSLTITGSGTEGSPFIRTSNLTLEVVQTMANDIIELHDTLKDRRVHDEEFFRNSRKVSDEYQMLRGFSDMGGTASYLLQNYIGSNKLLTRINS